MAVRPIDARAKEILVNTYWSPKGWIDNRTTAPKDFAYAKQHGLMFDAFSGSHDQLIAKLKRAVKAIEPKEVCQAFLASLSTRRPDLRSGLASWAFANALKRHAFKADSNGTWCEVCGGLAKYTNEDLNVLSFERHKWGGVRHEQPLYEYVDLISLRRALPTKPEPEDHALWAKILDTVTRMPKSEGPSKLAQRLKDVVPSSKDERNQLLEILAIVGVLAPKAERSSPGEWSHVGMWRAADRYDATIAANLFGKPRRSRSRA